MPRWIMAGLVLLVACGEDAGGGRTEQCPQQLADGSCAGAAVLRYCGGDFCTGDASCATTLRVRPGATGEDSLAGAAARTSAGDCIALAPGSYVGVELPAGVSLLGAGMEQVTLTAPPDKPALVVRGGAGLLRGFTIKGPGRGLALDQAAGVVVEQVKLEGTTELGLEVRAGQAALKGVTVDQVNAGNTAQAGVCLQLTGGAKLKASGLLVQGCAAQGILVHESSLDLSGSMVRDCKSYGISLACQGSACQTTLASALASSTLSNNTDVGLLLAAGKLSATDLTVTLTRSSVQGARGIELQQQAELQLTGGEISDSEGVGLLVNDAGGKVSGAEIADNLLPGVWVQASSTPLLLQDNTIQDNGFAGVTTVGAGGVTVSGGTIGGTKKKVWLTDQTSIAAGDGVQVLAGSTTVVSKVTLQGNSRVGVLLDSSLGKVSDSTFDGGEAALVVQNGSIDPTAFSNNKAGDGTSVQPQAPATVYPVKSKQELVSSLPMPLPPP